MLLSLLVLCLTGGSAASAAEPGDRRPADVAAIRAHIDSVFEAYRRKDREAVRRTHSPDWRGFLTGSRGVLRGIDEYMRDAEGFLGSPARIERWSFRDLDVLFYGETGVVSYVADLDIGLEGRTEKDTLRVLDIYRREGSQWQQVASQVARHPDAPAGAGGGARDLSATERAELLSEREAIWRAFFAGDEPALRRIVPEELIAIDAGEPKWSDRSSSISSAVESARSGVRLTRLEFPRTEIRVYGDTAILYSLYSFETEKQDRRETSAGRATEVFVRRGGRWVNTGWHLDSGP